MGVWVHADVDMTTANVVLLDSMTSNRARPTRIVRRWVWDIPVADPRLGERRNRNQRLLLPDDRRFPRNDRDDRRQLRRSFYPTSRNERAVSIADPHRRSDTVLGSQNRLYDDDDDIRSVRLFLRSPIAYD